MALEIIIEKNSRGLESAEKFKATFGEALLSENALSDSEWRDALFLTREKLTKFEKVILTTDADGDVFFKHGKKLATSSTPSSSKESEVKKAFGQLKAEQTGVLERRKTIPANLRNTPAQKLG